MINSISIENFRCFHRLQIKGFKNINLIGGQNNSGKTALLEALLLLVFPSPRSIILLRQLRNEHDSLIKNVPEQVWDYFFYNKNKECVIKIISNFFDNQGDAKRIKILTNSKKDARVEISSTTDVEEITRIMPEISSKFSDAAVLNVKGSGQKKDFNYLLFPNKEDGDIKVIGKALKGFNLLPFLHSAFRLNDYELSNLYSLAKGNKKIKKLNEMLKLLDSRIIGSEIDAPGGEPVIKLILDDEQSFPLAMFGDAIRKVTEIVLVILNTSDGIILIDEIENGIHFTKYKDLWTKLFEVIGDDVQIFATSHSAEMIAAFNEVAYQTKFEEKAIYFEMSRIEKTHKIVVSPMNMDILNYKLLSNNSYRGE